MHYGDRAHSLVYCLHSYNGLCMFRIIEYLWRRRLCVDVSGKTSLGLQDCPTSWWSLGRDGTHRLLQHPSLLRSRYHHIYHLRAHCHPRSTKHSLLAQVPRQRSCDPGASAQRALENGEESPVCFHRIRHLFLALHCYRSTGILRSQTSPRVEEPFAAPPIFQLVPQSSRLFVHQ